MDATGSEPPQPKLDGLTAGSRAARVRPTTARNLLVTWYHSNPTRHSLVGKPISASALLEAPVTAREGLYLGQFESRFETMAAQCPFAKLDEPLVCCGKWAHICGIRRCPFAPDFTARNVRFARRVFRAVENTTAKLSRAVKCATGPWATKEPRELIRCGDRPPRKRKPGTNKPAVSRSKSQS